MVSRIPIAIFLLMVYCHWGRALAINPNQQEKLFFDQNKDSYDFPDVDDYAVAQQVLEKDPAFLLELLAAMKANRIRPMANIKRGIDFGLGRGFSGSQAAKHFLGMAAASFSGGPGKRK